jgi:hypothetical protein
MFNLTLLIDSISRKVPKIRETLIELKDNRCRLNFRFQNTCGLLLRVRMSYITKVRHVRQPVRHKVYTIQIKVHVHVVCIITTSFVLHFSFIDIRCTWESFYYNKGKNPGYSMLSGKHELLYSRSSCYFVQQ